MTRRAAQFCLGIAALIAAIYAAAIPFPPGQRWEGDALLHLGLLSILSVPAAILLSFSPRSGRRVGLLLAIAALGQVIAVVVEILRLGGRPSPMRVAVGLAPWALAVIAGAILLLPTGVTHSADVPDP